ncbi:MAG: bifunctional (p)ppGpp synthetase/guanosine-3',5'-bis(diphosphate) 3'-pyrophosphohydrolase [Muribaculaceae bacterium]|nr:bifunctional (p)ppGpp synthetase/guanosine-3',5'-bis(diphosphate) 3'-pyrophosphohydrolase [Muribaculaceae bacterium]
MTQDKQMSHQEEEHMIESAYQEVLQAYINSNHRKKVEIIERAYRFAREAHKGVRRRSGEPYILHPISVAKIVISELGLGSTSICAALLHDVVEDTEYTKEDIEAAFGKKIADIVEGLTKISGGIFGDKASVQAENFRKLLLSMSTDIRVVLIKMADRLHNMRTLGSLRPEKQYKIAGETLYVYAPLAHRLGLFKIKQELEDLAFRYEHPQTYKEIMEYVDQSHEQREKIVEEFVAPVRKKLDAAGFKYEIKARVKSVYSIYNKMKKKQVSLDEIYDIYAVRVVFECDDEENAKVQCWQIYTYFADGHKTHPDRLRDWLSAPKANGYQALHLTAMGPDGKWIEVQIRSRKMHEIAELGYAAHWKYKTGDKDDDSELDNWMNTIKDILANPEPSAIDFLDTIKLNLYASEIYVFTPKGDLQILPKGATVLDMAYAIHTELGAHCIAGKINHRLVPLSHELSSGDQVEIITSDSQSPQSEWLKFCRTAKAQTAIRSMMKKDYKGLVERGSRLFMEFMSKEGIEPTNEVVSKILGRFHLKNRDELYVMLANDEILLPVEELRKMTESRQSLFSKLLRNSFSSKKKDEAGTSEKINRKEIYVLYSDEKSSNYRIEDCCCPIPGDDVLGFVDDDEKVVLHKADCAVATRLKSTYGNRLVATRWERHADKFVVTISIDGIDRKGMLEDLTAVLSRELCINIRGLNIKADQEVFHCDLTAQVDSTATVELICSSLKKIKGVKFAKRIS